MSTFYKVFIIIFIVFIAINVYAIDWKIGFLHSENYKFIFSIATGLLGILLSVVMNIWRKVAEKK